MSEPRCICDGWTIPGTALSIMPPMASCPVHGKALRKRSPDGWSAIMGATPPNSAQITEKGGATHVQ